MKATGIYKQLYDRAQGDPVVYRLVSLVDEVFEECKLIYRTVMRHMPQYTLHDEEHILRIVELMDRLLPGPTLQYLGPLELAALILSAILHDIGMAPSEAEIRKLILENSDPSCSTNEDSCRRAYRSFREAYPAILERQHKLRLQKRHYEAQELEAYLIGEYLRQTHGVRVKQFVFKRYHTRFVYADFNFASRITEVCYSHTQDPLFLEQLPCWELVRVPGEYVNWRFIALLLRLADILDFDGKRTPAILFEHLGIRDKVSLREWKKHRSIRAWDIRPGRIAFSARCPDPIIEKCVRDFIKTIEQELSFARGTLGSMHDLACPDMQQKYSLQLPPNIDVRNIGPEEGKEGPVYNYVDLGFYLDQESIVSLLMGVNLYGNRLLFLRELLQNAVDTCRHRQALHKSIPGAPQYTPEITVELLELESKWFFAVEDNGMGMDEEIVREHFARIGKSYYRSGRFLQEKTELHVDFQPISTFGIGVLSVFMVADKLRVQTRRLKNNLYDLDSPLDIEINGPTGLFWFRKSERNGPGTRLVLELREEPSFLISKPEHVLEWRTEKRSPSLWETVKWLAPHVEFPITVYEKGEKHKVEADWSLPKVPSRGLEAGLCHEVVIDLTSEGPDGLNGIVRVLLLQDFDGDLCEEVELEGFYCEELGREICDRLVQQFGYIEHVHVDYSGRTGGVEEGYSIEFFSMGRWSRQGFRVQQPLFTEHKVFADVRVRECIDYPFVIYYDLDLSGDFTVNLTVDRLRIVPDTRFEDVKKRICEVISTLLLSKLGKSEVRRHACFFRRIFEKASDDTVKAVLKHCLQCVLNE